MRYVELPLTELVSEDLLPALAAWLTNDAYCPIGSASPVWFDIETTGLSATSACVYMIGAVMQNEDRSWIFRQWFAELPSEEIELLQAFSESLPKECALLHFNGTTFDIPFLRDRCRFLGLDITWPTVSVDLYTQLRKLKRLAMLDSCRQRDLEPYAGYTRIDPYDGGTLIGFYSEYVKCAKLISILRAKQFDDNTAAPENLSSENDDSAAGGRHFTPIIDHVIDESAGDDIPYSHEDVAVNRYDSLARHNREDLAGLVSLVRLFDCFEILNGNLTDAELSEYGNHVSFTLITECKWPEELLFFIPLRERFLTMSQEHFDKVITLSVDEDGHLTLSIPILTEPAKHFYDNYRDYYYLPVEGRVIHKSIGAHMDRAYCRPAKREEAFDWFRGELLPQVGEVFSPCFLYGSKDVCLLFPMKELPKHPERHLEYVKGILSLFLYKKK